MFTKESPVSVELIERVIALFIDEVLIIIGTLIILFSSNSIITINGLYLEFILAVIVILGHISYFTFVPLLWSGQTVGKRVMGIRIATLTGDNLTFQTLLIRSFFISVLYLLFPVAIGSIALALTRGDKRSLHDIVTSTYVGYSRAIQFSETNNTLK
ncbi:RDD family protein [Bacillus suaedae]|uniref:RDD family protein n=1 Tax=Halalkalibacter suaedae TaxID=2822140 RepID=A0A940X0Q0_9BACI|nr:RDD family protein [Bacillus suaedae]MBP3953076.1 RDD family protein [Bacillus suaedae]